MPRVAIGLRCRAMRAVQIEEFGGPEVLRLAELPVPEPGPGELLIRVSRAGLNFGDTHQRRNQYIAKHELPVVLGGEVAGVVERVGPPADDSTSGRDHSAVKITHGPSDVPGVGDRAIALLRTGGYAEYAVAPAARAFRIPDGVSDIAVASAHDSVDNALVLERDEHAVLPIELSTTELRDGFVTGLIALLS